MLDRDLWAVLSGTGTMLAFSPDGSATELPLHRGEVFVLDGSSRVRATHNPRTPLVVVAIHFVGGDSLPFRTTVVPMEFLAGLLNRCLRARLRGQTESAVRWFSAAMDEVALASRAPGSPDPTAQKRSVQDQAVSELLDEIVERPGDDWRVGAMARRLGISGQHLGRLFHAATGRSPKEFVVEARTQAAKAYLRGSSLPLKRIAAELGYHDEFHFSRQFRNRVGTSPSSWRAKPTR